MTCENGVSLPASDLSVDSAMSRLRHALPRLRRRTAPQPWVWERLATPEEISQLRKTELRRAA